MSEKRYLYCQLESKATRRDLTSEKSYRLAKWVDLRIEAKSYSRFFFGQASQGTTFINCNFVCRDLEPKAASKG